MGHETLFVPKQSDKVVDGFTDTLMRSLNSNNFNLTLTEQAGW